MWTRSLTSMHCAAHSRIIFVASLLPSSHPSSTRRFATSLSVSLGSFCLVACHEIGLRYFTLIFYPICWFALTTPPFVVSFARSSKLAQFVACARLSGENRLHVLRDLLSQLPPEHYTTLQFVFKHLSKVVSLSAKNKVWSALFFELQHHLRCMQ